MTGSNLNILYALLTLKKFTDSTHPMSTNEIAEKMAVYFDMDEEDCINAKTVGRLLDDISLCQDPSLLGNLSFSVGRLMRNKMGIFSPYKSSSSKKGPTRYYYFESKFTDEELYMLCDAVETYNYFGLTDITSLYKKLADLRPKTPHSYGSQSYDASLKNKMENDIRVLDNVRVIGEIIAHNATEKEKLLMQILYCSYDYKNGKLELLPKKGGKLSTYIPLKLLWSNGYYYVAALGEWGNNPINLRIDRIASITAIPPEDKNYYMSRIKDMDKEQHEALRSKSVYRAKNPIMYGGKMERIHILVRSTPRNNILNAIADIFGRDVKIMPANDSDFAKVGSKPAPLGEDDETWYVLSITTSTFGVELACTQYCDSMFVLSPDHLRESIMQRIRVAKEVYGV